MLRGVCSGLAAAQADESGFPTPAGTPVGALRPEAAALFHVARRGSSEDGAAHLPAGHCAKPTNPYHRGRPGEQGDPAHRRSRFGKTPSPHPPVWFRHNLSTS